MFIKNFLEEIELQQYVPTFIENGITSKETLLLVKDVDAKELIPMMGPRLLFCQALVKLRAEKIESSDSIKNVNPGDDAYASTSSSPSFSSNSSPGPSDDKPQTEEEESIVVPLAESSTPQSPKSYTNPLKRKSPDKSCETDEPKKLKIDSTCNTSQVDLSKVEDMKKYLTDILGQTLNGQAVLSGLKKGLFDETLRNMLIEALVNYELRESGNMKISREKFKYLSTSISKLIPSESPFVYFIPAQCFGKTKISAKGKLYENYVRKLRVYSKAGLRISHQQQSQPESSTVTCEGPEDTVDFKNDIAWLQISTEPFDILAAKWEATSQKRTFQYHSSSKRADEYMAEFPALKKDFGHRLITIDFKKRHPGAYDNFFEKWPIFVQQTFALVQQRCRERKEFRDTLKADVPSFFAIKKIQEVDEEERNFLILSILPFLLKPPSVSKKEKYTKREVKEAFIRIIPSQAELRSSLQARNENAAELKMPIQPTPIFVGTNPRNMVGYVEVNCTLYSMCSIMQAISVCFQSFFVLNLEYPKAASKVWKFIQQYIFQVNPNESPDPDIELLQVTLSNVTLPE